MRFLALALVLLLPLASAQGPVLWFQGDGGDYSTVPTPDAPTFTMLADGHNDMETHYFIQGSNDVDADENPAAATFVYDGVVTLQGGEVTAFIARDHRGSGAISGATFAQLFDGAGNVLGPAEGIRVNDATPYGFPSGTKEEAAYVFEGIAGTFDGLKVQFTTFFADTGTPGADFWWGSDAAPGRLALAAEDVFGVPPEPVLAQTILANLTGPNATIHHEWQASIDTYTYNWTAPNGSLEMTLNSTINNGSVWVNITDAAGIRVLEQEFSNSTSIAPDLAGTFPGAWNITLAYKDFNGTLDLHISQAPAGEPIDDGNGTMEPPAAPEDEESPLPLGLLVIAIAFAVIRRRK